MLNTINGMTQPTTPTPVGIIAGMSMLKARRGQANKLARIGMRLHKFDQHDQMAWSIFYKHVDAYLRETGYFTQSQTRMTPKAAAAMNALYERAAAEVNFGKNLF